MVSSHMEDFNLSTSFLIVSVYYTIFPRKAKVELVVSVHL